MKSQMKSTKSRIQCIKLIKFRQSNRPANDQPECEPKCDPVHCLIYGHLGYHYERVSSECVSSCRLARRDECEHRSPVNCRTRHWTGSSLGRFISRFSFEARLNQHSNHQNLRLNSQTKRYPLNGQNVNKRNAVVTLNSDNVVACRKVADGPAGSRAFNYKNRICLLSGTTSRINNNEKIERRNYTQSKADKERNPSHNSNQLRASSCDSAIFSLESLPNSILNSRFRNSPVGLVNGTRCRMCHSNRMNRTSYTTEPGNKPGLCSTRQQTHLSEVKIEDKLKENLDQKRITVAEAGQSIEDGWPRGHAEKSTENFGQNATFGSMNDFMGDSMHDRTKDYVEGHLNLNGSVRSQMPASGIQRRTSDKKNEAYSSHLNYLEDKERNETHLMNPVEQVNEQAASEGPAAKQATKTAKLVGRLNNQTKYQSRCFASEQIQHSPFKRHLFTDSKSDQNRISDKKSPEHEFQFELSDCREQNAVNSVNGTNLDHKKEAQHKACRSLSRAQQKASYHSEISYQFSYQIPPLKIRHFEANATRQKSLASLLGKVQNLLLLLAIICPHLSASELNRPNFRNQTANFLSAVRMPTNRMAAGPHSSHSSHSSSTNYNDTAGDPHPINSINSFESLDLLNSAGSFKPINSIGSLNSISTIALDDVKSTLFDSYFGSNLTSDSLITKTAANYPPDLNFQSALERYQNQLALESNSINETNFTSSSLYPKDKWFLKFFPKKYVDAKMELSEFLFRVFGVFICSILLCLTLFGNVLTITVVLRFNRMKTVTNILLAR